MNRFYSLVIITSFFLACTQKPTSDALEYDFSIKGASIIDVETGEIKPNQTILVNADGRILIPSKEMPWTSRQKIEGKGKFIIPALWDMHVHFRGGEELIGENKALLSQYIAYGVTTVRDAGGDLTSSIRQWEKEIESGNLVGPKIFTSGPKIDGPEARWAGSLEVSNEAEIDQALDSLESLKVDYIKLYDSKLSGEMYLTILEKAEKRGLKVSGHMPFTVMLQDAIDRKVTSIEHLYYVLKGCSSKEKEITEKIRKGELGFWASMAQLIESFDEEVAKERFTSMAQNGVFVVPTLHIGNVLSYLDQVDHSNDPNLSLIGQGIQETYQGRIKSAMGASKEAIENRHNLHQKFRTLIPKLQKAGVKLLAGSDGGAYNSYVYPGYSLHQELAIMVESGLTPLEALQTATLNGTEFFDLSADLIKVKNGSTTDLLILTGNPLENIKNTQAIDGLILNGKYLSKGDLQKLLVKPN